MDYRSFGTTAFPYGSLWHLVSGHIIKHKILTYYIYTFYLMDRTGCIKPIVGILSDFDGNVSIKSQNF